MEHSSYNYFKTKSKKGWLEIRFSNGEYNFITPNVLLELDGIINSVCQDDGINCAVLRSESAGVFSHGMDIKLFNSMRNEDKIEFIHKARNILSKLDKAPIPFITAIQGDCYGAGLELILSCDIRISTYSSKFAAPEVIFSLIPTGGSIQRLLRLVGRGQTARLLLSGMAINARESLQIGLIEEAVDEDKLDERCEQLANRLGKIQRSGITAIKEAIFKEETMLLKNQLQKGLKQ